MSPIETKERDLYNGKETQSTKALSAIFYIQDLITKTQRNHIKNTIIPQFKANLKYQSFEILNRMSLVI